MFQIPISLGGDQRFNIASVAASGDLQAQAAGISGTARLSGHIQVGPPGGAAQTPRREPLPKIICMGSLRAAPAAIQCTADTSWHDYNEQALLLLLAA